MCIRDSPSATLLMWPTMDEFPVDAARSERVGDTESSPRVSIRSACGKTLEICEVSRRVGYASEEDPKEQAGKQVVERESAFRLDK